MNCNNNSIKMELVKPRNKKSNHGLGVNSQLRNSPNVPYNNYIYYGASSPKTEFLPGQLTSPHYHSTANEPIYSPENDNKAKIWCQTGVKDLTKEHEKQRRKYYEKFNPTPPSYVAPIYDKHVYFGSDYVILCRFQIKYIVDYSKAETKPYIDLESLKRFMNTYVMDVVLRTPDNKIYSTKTGFTKINEYIIRGLVNIALDFGACGLVSTDEKIKSLCQSPPYSLACLLINPDDDYHKQHPNGSQYKAYNLICKLSHYTKPAAKQELGEERGFYIMQMGQTYYLISHEICIKELQQDSTICLPQMDNVQQNILSFDNIAAMYTGCIKGNKITKVMQSNELVQTAQTAQTKQTENEIIYSVTWSKFYLSEITKETSIEIMQNIVSFRTFVKPVRDEGYYIGHTKLTPRQKLIFDIVTMFCDGLSVGFELKNI